jgi:hypothetical protein
MNWTHQTEFSPTAQNLLDAFRDEITTAGGTVSDVFEMEQQLIARAILPASAEIRVRDAMNAGVAIRATQTEIAVHPYTFRQVCTNGSVMVQMLQSRRAVRLRVENGIAPSYESSTILEEVREGIRVCASPDTFAAIESDLQLSTEADGLVMLHMLHHIGRSMHARIDLATSMLIQRRYREDRDRSAFGVMNAVTSVARDTSDPVARWNLESIGGSIPALARRHSGFSRDRTADTAVEPATVR